MFDLCKTIVMYPCHKGARTSRPPKQERDAGAQCLLAAWGMSLVIFAGSGGRDVRAPIGNPETLLPTRGVIRSG